MSKYLIAILLSAWSISLRAQVAEKLQQLGMENIQTVTEINVLRLFIIRKEAIPTEKEAGGRERKKVRAF